MISSLTRPLRKLKTYDDTRDSFPGEHWLMFGAGVVLLLASSRSPSPLKRAVGSAVGGAMLLRAASGRDGLARIARHLPDRKGLIL